MTKSRGIKKRYSPEEDVFIKKQFLNLSLNQLGNYLKRTSGSIKSRCKILGLKLPEEIKELRAKATIKFLEEGKKFRFEKGNIPANKGTKGLSKANIASFKPGHKPFNTKYNGCISLRTNKNKKSKYLYIRLAENKWVELHRYLWQLYHGHIPKGGVVRFRDGNSLHCTEDNLELITQRINMRRNSIHNLPKDLKEIAFLNGKITKFIKRHEKEYGRCT